ncbi:MAG: hypothetical protein MKZ95_12080 [Pirellulales bacterium]|nr:hypothetical protein [Pirellulales bacterium]
MIHFTCDCCKRTIDTDNDLRYVVRLEVYASLDSIESELDSDRDHLQEIQNILEELDDSENEQIGDDVYHQTRYDLCSKCREQFLRNPLGKTTSQELNFSSN